MNSIVKTILLLMMATASVALKAEMVTVGFNGAFEVTDTGLAALIGDSIPFEGHVTIDDNAVLSDIWSDPNFTAGFYDFEQYILTIGGATNTINSENVTGSVWSAGCVVEDGTPPFTDGLVCQVWDDSLDNEFEPVLLNGTILDVEGFNISTHGAGEVFTDASAANFQQFTSPEMFFDTAYIAFQVDEEWFYIEDLDPEFFIVENDEHVAIDIKFCSDPNAFNCKKKGVLPVTIFGTEEFDVLEIDTSTLRLCTEDLVNCTGMPRNSSVSDRGNPSTDLGAAMCMISEVDDGIYEEQDFLNPDGFLDLDVAFEATEVQTVLGFFCEGNKGAVSEPLVLTGATMDGTSIVSVPIPNVGTDQLLKVNK